MLAASPEAPRTGRRGAPGARRRRVPAHDRLRRGGGRPRHPPMGAEVLDEVTSRAGDLAAAREAETVGTPDLLFAVLDVYGKLFDRVLYMRGTSREELAERLVDAGGPAPHAGLGRGRLGGLACPRVLLELAPEVEEVVRAGDQGHGDHRVDERLDPGGVRIARGDQRQHGGYLHDRLDLAERVCPGSRRPAARPRSEGRSRRTRAR